MIHQKTTQPEVYAAFSSLSGLPVCVVEFGQMWAQTWAYESTVIIKLETGVDDDISDEPKTQTWWVFIVSSSTLCPTKSWYKTKHLFWNNLIASEVFFILHRSCRKVTGGIWSKTGPCALWVRLRRDRGFCYLLKKVTMLCLMLQRLKSWGPQSFLHLNRVLCFNTTIRMSSMQIASTIGEKETS